MRLAIIDLGTNSVRFDVHELGPEGQIFHLHREKLMIRLGDGVFLKGRLSQRQIRICLEAFQSFQTTMNDFRVHRIVAFGTAALREAKDGDRLIQKIFRETGIRIRIISGDEEARLIARGVLTNEPTPRGRVALIDIGGGSTEITVCQGKKVLRSASFPVGTARLQQVFLKTIPPSLPKKGKPHPIELLRRHIRSTLLYRLVSEDWPRATRILGSSGTIRAIGKVLKKQTGSDFFTRQQLDDFVEVIQNKNRRQLLEIPGMEARRVDMILAGALLLQECLNALHATSVSTTEFSLRDGILDEQIELLREDRRLYKFDILHDLFETAKSLGCLESELRQSLKTAWMVFDKLQKLHRLKPEWKRYLSAAILLHDTGKSISPIHSVKHSAYVARFADVPALEPWETKLLSELCLQSKNGKISKKDMPFKKDKAMASVYLKLLALLRLTVGLSYQRTRPVVIDRVLIAPKDVRIVISKRNHPELSILRADQKRMIFEDVFKKRLSFEWS